MRFILAITFLHILVAIVTAASPQTMNSHDVQSMNIGRITDDFPIGAFNHSYWEKAAEKRIDHYWSGANAPAGRWFALRMLWSKTALYVRFEVSLSEPTLMSDSPNLTTKTIGLWERDVCEIFIAPDRGEPEKYFEFEIAPNGEWIDLFIDYTGKRRKTDWEYSSGMESAASIEKDRILMAIKVPWTAFGKTPRAGDVWKGNLFRAVGKDPDRGYLAWRPTMTKTPNFHVPERFGEFIFEK